MLELVASSPSKVELSYFGALAEAMRLCAEAENSVFIGQGVGLHGGTTMSQTLHYVPEAKRLEMPVAEDMQMGMAIGMSLEGLLPICIFPRWNFLLLAANQLINHLDRLPLYSDGGYQPKVIIRTAIPSTVPFNPGPQHDDDFTEAFTLMTRTIKVVRLSNAEQIVPAYKAALECEGSTLLVEYTHYYKDARAHA
jgi:pyruvate/2-oxoglutarate/acetoin dehydrogenase E1 component